MLSWSFGNFWIVISCLAYNFTCFSNHFWMISIILLRGMQLWKVHLALLIWSRFHDLLLLLSQLFPQFHNGIILLTSFRIYAYWSIICILLGSLGIFLFIPNILNQSIMSCKNQGRICHIFTSVSFFIEFIWIIRALWPRNSFIHDLVISL